MRLQYWIILVMAITTASCKYSEGLEEQEVKGRFKISVTDYMSESDELHPQAVFQYSSPYRTVYLLVLDTPRIDLSLAAYGKIASEKLVSALTDSTITPIDSVTAINGAPAIAYELEGNITNERVWYYMAIVEGKQHYYQILGWTILQRKEKYGKHIEDMVRSFKLVE
ncbi:hypothetical protein BH09BAC1_BH09BAC1_21000 [soil metagenome]